MKSNITTNVKVTSVKTTACKNGSTLTVVKFEDAAGRRMYQKNWGTSDLTRAKINDCFKVCGTLEPKPFKDDKGIEHVGYEFAGQPVCKIEKLF